MIDQDIEKLLSVAPLEERARITSLLKEYAKVRNIEAARGDFLSFVRLVWPGFIHGRHHEVMADAFERVLSGDLKRLIINMPPRFTKSELASIHLPAYFLGRFPDRKIIKATHTAELAVGFGRKVRSIVNSEDFQNIFPDVSLSADSKAAGRWSTNKRGEYFAIGVGGAVAGRGADLLVIDDPVDEQTALFGEGNPEVYAKIYEWYTLLRQRLQPSGAIIVLMTRWSMLDLTGRLLKRMTQGEGEEWELIELPAVLPSGESLWPEYWPIEELEKVKQSISVSRWQSQYQQAPTSEEGALIKREWWRRWEKDKTPKCNIIIQSWDTAFEKSQRSDYSACTTWGVFDTEDEDGAATTGVILLDAVRGKWEFPDLKARVKRHYMDYEPDMVIVEKKAAGSPLVYELRRMGIPVQEFTPTTRTGDKIVRVNAITDIFASGMVWAPYARWADEVIEECSAFPLGEHDDYVDTVSQALSRIRKGGMIATRNDEDDEEEILPRRRYDYY